MKVTKILFDAKFEKKFEKYKSKLTQKQKDNLKQKLSIFKENAFDSRLSTHKLSWKLQDYYSFSITYKDRLKFKLLEDATVYFYDIWSHDEVY